MKLSSAHDAPHAGRGGTALVIGAALAGLTLAYLSWGGGASSEAARARAEGAESAEAQDAATLLLPAVRPTPEGDPASAEELEAGDDRGRRAAEGTAAAEAFREAPAPTPAWAVYGQVVDALGRPQSGVSVRLTDAYPAVEATPELGGPRAPGVGSGIRLGGPMGATLSSSELQLTNVVVLTEDGARVPTEAPRLLDRTTGPGRGSPNSPGGPIVEPAASPGVLFHTSRAGIAEHSTKTDAAGEFEFGDVYLTDRSRLVYGAELFAGAPPSQPVLADDRPQLLRLPAPPTSGLRLELIGPENEAGEPSVPDPLWVTLDLESLAEGVASGRHRVPDHDLELSAGSVVARGLAPGRWRAWIHCAGAPPVQQQLAVEAVQGLTVVPVEIPLDPEAAGLGHADLPVHLHAGNAEVTPDSFAGFDDYAVKGQTSRGFGGRDWDAFFAHTITGFGNGPVRGAVLELDLEAVNGMCSNDSVGLEYRGADASPRWAWSAAIPSLPGANGWRSGARRRIVLDLAHLPTKSGSRNLLQDLEDGYLDVFVQDDTSVHAVTLRTFR